LTTALDGGGVQLYPQEKNPPVPTGEEAGWVPAPVWTWFRRGKFPAPAGNRIQMN